MKKIFRKVVIILMAVVTTISMSACSTINQETASDVRNALNAKYGEDFEVLLIGDRLNTSTATTYVHPVADRDIIFTAKIDHDGNVFDDYVNHIILNSIEKNIVAQFEGNGISAVANAVVTEGDVIETDRTLDPNSFAAKNGIESILVRLVIDYKNESAESIISTLEKATAEYHFDLVVGLYLMNHDSFESCKNDLKNYPSVGATRIDGYSPLFSKKTVLSNGKSSVTANDFATFMEGK